MNENQPIMIQIESLSAAYENRTVLRDVNLSIYEKDFLGIIGPNGGGKTTLIKTILGLIKPVMGNIQFYRNGQPAESITMGYLPQYNSIDRKFPISVEEVILSGLSGKKALIGKFSREHHAKVHTGVRRRGLQGLENGAIGHTIG